MYDRLQVLELLDGAPPAHTLPQAFYQDPALYAFDMYAIFARSWVMLGFEAELPEPGSYLSVTIGPHPILVVRDRQGSIRGFHNTCRHRGAQICEEGSGCLPRIVCPYHKWSYGLDGALLAAPRMPAGLDFEAYGLKPIRIELLEGCVYGALSSNAPDFEPFRAAASRFLQPYRFREAKLAHQSVLIEQANWKLVMENARECYHCAAWHPELKLSFPVVFGTKLRVADEAQHARFAATLTERGLQAAPAAGAWWHVGRYPLNPGAESVSMDGRAVVTQRLFNGGENPIGGLRWATEPNTFCHAFTDYAFMFAALPSGPQETRVISKWLVPKEAREGVDYQLDKLTEVWSKTNLQDRALAENNQRGVSGGGYCPGPYAPDAEEFVIRFNDWYRTTAREAAENS